MSLLPLEEDPALVQKAEEIYRELGHIQTKIQEDLELAALLDAIENAVPDAKRGVKPVERFVMTF